jgi:hypothetical protein
MLIDGPLQVEDMADAGGQEILVVAGVAQQEHADIAHQIGVGAQVEIEIAAHAAAGIDTDAPGEAFGRVAGIFQRLPGHLQELAVLGVQDRGFLGREAEEFGVEMFEILQHGRGRDIVALAHPVGRFAGGKESASSSRRIDSTPAFRFSQ